MPWRGARYEGEFPSLGRVVGQWIEANCVIPDGFHQDERYVLTPEMKQFIVRYFRIRPEARPVTERPSAAFFYRGAQLMRPQKWGKSPFGAAYCLAFAFAPVVFDGWDANGEPVGRPHPSPWGQIVSTSEEQTDNVWLALLGMAQRGPIANMAGVDIGVMDINLPGGGKIEPRSSSGRARLGARLNFGLFDESHLMTESNGGVLLATTMKRNLGGMGGQWLETTNAFDPSENSIAQRTQESAAKDVLIDYRPPPRRPDLTDDQDSLELLAHVYGDSWWVDPERVLADARDPAVCPTTADAMRYFFNLVEVGVAQAVDPATWDAAARSDKPLRKGEAIALGFDGSRSRSCTSLVASRVSDGRWFHLRTWDPADYEDGTVPRLEVDKVITAAFAAYDVRFLYGVRVQWEAYLDIWAGRWPKRIVEFPTNSDQRMDGAISRFLARLGEDFTHDGNDVLGAHAKAAALAKGARKRPLPEEGQSVTLHYLKVVKKRETGHIDAFVAGLLADEARGQSIEKGGLEPSPEPLVAYV